MKVIYTPNPEYIHKVLVTAFEAGIHEQLEYERVVPFDDDTGIWNYNPLGKVPCLVRDNGEPLYGGLVVCEYLDSMSVTGRRLFPQDDSQWEARRRMVLGDALFDATTLVRVEGWRDKDDWNLDYMLRERRKMIGALDRMEVDAASRNGQDLDIGDVCFMGGLSYLELRNPLREYAIVDGDADFEWRESRPSLAAFFDDNRPRPCFNWNPTID
jgi:glutathione S-transferase